MYEDAFLPAILGDQPMHVDNGLVLGRIGVEYNRYVLRGYQAELLLVRDSF